jgi:hypothetical protein
VCLFLIINFIVHRINFNTVSCILCHIMHYVGPTAINEQISGKWSKRNKKYTTTCLIRKNNTCATSECVAEKRVICVLFVFNP